jgi:HAD superfamily hydrolase (TIGR01509 family)
MAAIVFDFDGVVVRSRLRDGTFVWQENLETDLGISVDLRNQIFKQPEWNEMLCGRMDFNEHLTKIFTAHTSRAKPKDFIKYWLANDLNWNRAVVEVAGEFRADGHFTYIATNQDRIRGEHIRKQPETADCFTKVFTSADFGVAKPDLQFFRQLKASVESEPAIMVDDDPSNIAAAKDCGFLGLCFNPDVEISHTTDWLRESLSQLLR